jgi:hypothetical protein
MNPKFLRQQQFVERLKKASPSNQKLADVLADLLEISNDSAYRRLRCETAFSLDEYVQVCDHFRIPLDFSGPETDSQAVFHFTLVSESEENTFEYLEKVYQSLLFLQKSSNAKVYYATEDIPLFYYFQFPELTAFKVFFWKKSILDDTHYQEKSFTKDSIQPELIALCRNIFDTYCQINSIEVYPEDTFSSTIRQLEYYWESDMLDSETGKLICDQLLETVQLIKLCAGRNSKNEHGGGLEMYLSDLMINTNTILVDHPQTKMVYKSVNTFNSISTSHQRFYEESKLWMDGLIRKSTMISGVSERHRNKLFKQATDQILALKNKL